MPFHLRDVVGYLDATLEIDRFRDYAPNGLQVEGALIDKRSHANDAAQTLEETKAFDDAVKVALDFAKKDGHTLVIVTADAAPSR